MNMDTVVVLTHGARLMVSTQHESDHAFRCEIFESNANEKDPLTCRIISPGFEAATCLEAQTAAYHYARRLYPTFADQMKKPPYLIWKGPSLAT